MCMCVCGGGVCEVCVCGGVCLCVVGVCVKHMHVYVCMWWGVCEVCVVVVGV